MNLSQLPACARLSPVLVLTLAVGTGAEPAKNGGLRELHTDRPDVTESPFTVDVGHLQLETDAASYTRNRRDGVRTTEWVVAPFNLRYGLTPDVEAGIFVTPFVSSSEQMHSGPKVTTRGVGDSTLRAKFNFWGNDGADSALGLIADVKLPTAAAGLGNGKVEAAVALPVAYEIGAGWEGGVMTVLEFAHTDAGRRAVWRNTVTFAKELTPTLGGYLELTSAAGDGAHAATFDFGITRKIGHDLQLDCGVNVGISRAAPDLVVFGGLSRRF